jgi:trans-o-hydroxybenzylidenepyruvate hydratase-aldolase
VRLRDAVQQARHSGDWTTARDLADEIKASLSTLFPKGDVAEFAKYNIGLEKARVDAAGWIKAGPCRPPYTIVPEEYLQGARKSGEAWSALDRKYRSAPATLRAKAG